MPLQVAAVAASGWRARRRVTAAAKEFEDSLHSAARHCSRSATALPLPWHAAPMPRGAPGLDVSHHHSTRGGRSAIRQEPRALGPPSLPTGAYTGSVEASGGSAGRGGRRARATCSAGRSAQAGDQAQAGAVTGARATWHLAVSRQCPSSERGSWESTSHGARSLRRGGPHSRRLPCARGCDQQTSRCV